MDKKPMGKEPKKKPDKRPVNKQTKRLIKKRKGPKLIVMGLLAAVLVGSVAMVLVEKFSPDQTMIPQSIVEFPSKLVSTLMKPMQGAFAWAGNTVSGYFEDLKLRKNIEIEYNKLKADNDQLVYEALRNEELSIEVERLKKLLKVSDEYREKELNPVMGTVIAKETGNWFQMFTIDVGTNDNVKENMAVVNADGLIGYIYKANADTSEVISIVDSRAGVAAIIQSTRDQGVIKGTLGIGEEATCRMYYLPVDLSPRPGDVVVTSGIGAPFPKGLVIGEVRESTRHMDENKHYVVIEPKVDFMHIEEVLVLVYKASGETMPEEANDGQIKYSPMPLDSIRPSPVVGEQVYDPGLGKPTPPAPVTRVPAEGETPTPKPSGGPEVTLEPGATPTPNPELDALMQEELAAEEDE